MKNLFVILLLLSVTSETQARKLVNRDKLLIQKKADIKLQDDTNKNLADVIGDSDPNAIFAFSQVIAAGGNVAKVCDDIE